MITVEVFGDKQLIARLTAMPDNIRSALVRKVRALALMLEAKVKGEKLSGQVLNVVTGALRRSISNEVTTGSNSVTAEVYSSGDVKYAAIHEYGGTIPAHEVVATKAQALHFVIGAKDVFAKRVQIPDVKMPERSFLRSSLDEMRDEIVEGMKEAVLEGAHKK